MNLFERPWLVSAASFLLLLVGAAAAGLFLKKIGVSWEDIALALSASWIKLLIAVFAITVPLSQALARRRADEKEELRRVYMGAATFIGSELVTNLDFLRKVKESTEKDYPDFENFSPEAKKQVKMGMIQAAASEVIQTLEERSYASMISSGALLKIPDEDLNNHIQLAYEDIKKCKTKLRQAAFLFKMVLNPPPGEVIKEVAKKQLEERVPEAIKMAEDEIDHTIKSIERCLETLNRVLEPYGKKFEIVEEPEQGQRRARPEP